MHINALPLHTAARAVAAAAAFAALTALATFAGGATAGPVSTMYLTSWSNKTLYTVQGNAVTGSAPTYCNHCEQPIAVDGDVRTMGAGNGYGGSYNLDLTQTGTTYVQSTLVSLTDGTTDGRRNYAVSPGYGGGISAVYAFNREWGDPTLLFQLDVGVLAEGITYDPTSNSLWLQATVETINGQGTAANVLRNYQMNGALIASLDDQGGGALAMDHADNSLWVVRGPMQFFDQYSRSGALLQTVSYAGLVGNNGIGAEFDLAGARADVAEPGSLALAGAALAGLALARRGRRTPVPPALF